MDSKTTETRTPYSGTNRIIGERERRSAMSNAIRKLKEILIDKGIKKRGDLSSQENVLFAVIKWISLEDLHPLFPPLVFNGTESKKEKYARNAQQRREKQSVAFSRMTDFIVGVSIGTWNQRPISRTSILEAVLQFIQNMPSRSSPLPVPPMKTKALPTEFKSPINPQMAIQPSATPLLKHSVDSMLEGARLINSNPQPNFFHSIHQSYLQSHISNLTLLGMFGQNQMFSPVENKKNGNESESVVFGTFKKFYQ